MTRGAEPYLAPFGAGLDGSLYCVWKDGQGNFPIVHLDSEASHNFVVAQNFRDFLKVLAVGYADLGVDDLQAPPLADESRPELKAWLQEDIPTSAKPILDETRSSVADLSAWLKQAFQRNFMT